MYIIRNKNTKSILHMSHSIPGQHRKPEELLHDFNPETMEFGYTEQHGIPAWFTIENGLVKPLPPPSIQTPPSAPPIPQQTPDLESTRAFFIEVISQRSFEERRKIIPDYQMQNAALGVYDEAQTNAIRDTVQAFRNTFYRLKALAEKAQSIDELQAIEIRFPSEISSKPKDK